MLTIAVSVGDQVIDKATAANVSNLADISNYEVRTVERGYEPLGIPSSNTQEMISGHERRSSVWSLVATVAVLARREQGDV
ncbi:hypothetical protein [Shimia sp.]|uniref:hypothetical protein n=1 Tax=Shimia sp. TaxID=1954381 RepID=UPI003BA99756